MNISIPLTRTRQSVLLRLLAPVILLLLLSGCASTEAYRDTEDPLEKMNRSIMTFNLESDRYLLKPVAEGYKKVVPGPIRMFVTNFFSNLGEPLTILNDVLQGKLGKAGRDTGRFVINTTLGFLGIIDVATDLNFPKQREDLGQTLAVWGVPSGPYLVLPFFGPSTVRDSVGTVSEYFTGDFILDLDSPEFYYVLGLRVVDARARLLGTDALLELQPDKYLFLKEAYLQQRTSQIYDGNPPEPEGDASDDALIDLLLEN